MLQKSNVPDRHMIPYSVPRILPSKCHPLGENRKALDLVGILQLLWVFFKLYVASYPFWIAEFSPSTH